MEYYIDYIEYIRQHYANKIIDNKDIVTIIEQNMYTYSYSTEEIKKYIQTHNNRIVERHERIAFGLFLEEIQLIALGNELYNYLPFKIENIGYFIDKKYYPNDNFYISLALLLSWMCHVEKDKNKIIYNSREIAVMVSNSKLSKITEQILKFANMFNEKTNIDFVFKLEHFSLKTVCATGIFHLPWANIRFDDARIFLTHPNNKTRVFRHNMANSRKAYNNVIEYFEKKLQPLYVESQDNKIIKICNPEIFVNCIQMFDKYLSIPFLPISPQNKKLNYFKSMNNNDLECYIIKLKSIYLNYLCELQMKEYNLLYCIERRINNNGQEFNEDAFIFTINRQKTKVIVVFENVLESRCSIVFVVKRLQYKKAINAITSFFLSAQINKREIIAQNNFSTENTGIISIHRILHTGIGAWKYEIAIKSLLF